MFDCMCNTLNSCYFRVIVPHNSVRTPDNTTLCGNQADEEFPSLLSKHCCFSRYSAKPTQSNPHHRMLLFQIYFRGVLYSENWLLALSCTSVRPSDRAEHVAFHRNDSREKRSVHFSNFMQRRKAVPYRRFGTAYWFHLQGSGSPLFEPSTAWPLKLWPICCPETSVTNCHSTPHKIPKERRAHLITPRKHKILFFVKFCVGNYKENSSELLLSVENC